MDSVDIGLCSARRRPGGTLYRSMQQEGFTLPSDATYACLQQACASVGAGALSEGKQVHAQIEKQVLQEDGESAWSTCMRNVVDLSMLAHFLTSFREKRCSMDYDDSRVCAARNGSGCA